MKVGTYLRLTLCSECLSVLYIRIVNCLAVNLYANLELQYSFFSKFKFKLM